jgi:hypothetical protein
MKRSGWNILILSAFQSTDILIHIFKFASVFKSSIQLSKYLVLHLLIIWNDISLQSFRLINITISRLLVPNEKKQIKQLLTFVVNIRKIDYQSNITIQNSSHIHWYNINRTFFLFQVLCNRLKPKKADEYFPRLTIQSFLKNSLIMVASSKPWQQVFWQQTVEKKQ